MIQSWMVSIKRYAQKHNNVLKPIHFSLFVIVLAVLAIPLSACRVDYGAYLNVDNRFPVDVTLVLSITTQNGQYAKPFSLGIIPASQTKDTRWMWVYKRSDIGLFLKVLLEGEDSSGKVVWQKTWTGAEFVKLEDSGWKIVVSPETSDQPASP